MKDDYALTYFPENLFVLVDKISRTVFNREENKSLYDQPLALLVSARTSKNPVYTTVSLNNANTEKLQLFDKIVYDAICSLYKANNEYISKNMIFHVISGNIEKSCSPVYKKAIQESLDRLMSTNITIDATGEYLMYRGLKDFTYSGKLLNAIMTTARLHGTSTGCIHFLDAPVLLKYAEAKKHLVRVESSLINLIPGKISMTKLLATYFILYRILSARKISPKINYSSVYSAIQYEDQDKHAKFLLRAYIKNLLSEWKNKVFRDIVLKDFEEIKRGGIPYQLVISYNIAKDVGKKDVSLYKKENYLYKFISGLLPEDKIILHDKHLCLPTGEKVELDLFDESKNLAIELDGVVFHNSALKDSLYHASKTDLCNYSGITLLHILDKELEYHKDLVDSYIKSHLGVFDSEILAEDCDIRPVLIQDYYSFINATCLGKKYNADKAIGLYNGSSLVAVLGYSGTTLANYCTIPGINIIGGMAKLTQSLVSLGQLTMSVDRRYTNVSDYIAVGFEIFANIKPQMMYVKDGYVGYSPEYGIPEESYFKVWDAGEFLLQMKL